MKVAKLADVIRPAKVQRAGSNPYPLLSMTMRHGLVPQGNKFKKQVAGADLSQYKVVEHNQLVVGFPIDEAVLAFQRSIPAGLVSPAYGVWDLADGDKTDALYLERFLRSPRAIGYYKAKLQGSTARRRSLPTPVFLDMDVPLPPLDEQRRIAAILDKADELRTKRRQALAHLDTLTQSIFHSMFGDSSAFHTTKLDALCDVSSGITKGRKTPLSKLTAYPYLSVSNVQDRALDMRVVKEIAVSAQEADRFRLKKGDLLLTEGGDPDKLGRGTVWNEELPWCLHQNHVFKVRPQTDIEPLYLSLYLASPVAKKYFLRMAKQTTGIASINKTQLSATPITVPPLELQKAFVTRVAVVERLKDAHQKHLAELDVLFASLQYRAFKGEL